MLNILGVFSGIGGLELGLEWSGLGPPVVMIERDPFCAEVLRHQWPDAEIWEEDVEKIGAGRIPRADIVCGGFPCQDVSAAGKRTGLSGARSGLWGELRRVIRGAKSPFVVVENVASGSSLWLPTVLSDLDKLGYRTLPIEIRASDVGAPHRRSRVFVIGASADRILLRRNLYRGMLHRAGGHAAGFPDGTSAEGREEALPDGDRDGLAVERGVILLDGERAACGGDPDRRDGEEDGREAEPLLGGVSHGLSGGVDRCRRMDLRPRAWPAPREDARFPWEPPPTISRGERSRLRPERLRAIGNSVVPHCAEVVGWMIRGILALEGLPTW
jgi:DNA (cytosine-5)-methyltransferase 1